MARHPATYRGVVYPWHCDHMGHMNVMWYVGMFDEATWTFFAGFGLSSSFLRENNRGMAALEQHLTYHRELLPGDVIEISTNLLEVREKSLRFRHEMKETVSGQLSATCELVALHIDTKIRKGTAFSLPIQEALAAVLPGDHTDQG
ncbi:MAG: acyl-CoA thioesterase [Paracoccaceae bacterium]